MLNTISLYLLDKSSQAFQRSLMRYGRYRGSHARSSYVRSQNMAILCVTELRGFRACTEHSEMICR